MFSQLSILAAVGTVALGAGPPFTWDTVPVYSHMCNKSGEFSPETVAALAKFPIVTVEKGQAVDQPGWAEDKIVAALKQVREANPAVHTVMYLNSVLSWEQYKLSQTIASDPKYQLLNDTGKPVRQHGDHSFKQPPNGMLIYGFDKQPARSAWSGTCLTAVSTGYVDSCFSDRSSEDSFHDNVLSPATQAAYTEGHAGVQRELQTALDGQGNGGFVVANNGVVQGVRAGMYESFGASNASINAVLQYVRNGFGNNTAEAASNGGASKYDQRYLLEVHAGYHPDGDDNHCKDGVTNSLAAFLIAAGPNSYYGCASDWVVSKDDQQWVKWWPEYSKPLGEPKGPGVYDPSSGSWSREFGAGTVVTFDAGAGTGRIEWSDGTVSQGRRRA